MKLADFEAFVAVWISRSKSFWLVRPRKVLEPSKSVSSNDNFPVDLELKLLYHNNISKVKYELSCSTWLVFFSYLAKTLSQGLQTISLFLSPSPLSPLMSIRLLVRRDEWRYWAEDGGGGERKNILSSVIQMKGRLKETKSEKKRVNDLCCHSCDRTETAFAWWCIQCD